MEENQPKPDEKLAFLKREEITTMQKDIVKLREMEAQKEKERIALAPDTSQKETPEGTPKIVQSQQEPGTKIEIQIEKERLETLIPKFHRKPSTLQKILVRVGMVLILFLFVGFFYWLLEVRKVEPPKEEELNNEEVISQEPEIIIPVSLISVDTIEILEDSTIKTASTSLSEILGKKFDADTFVRILIENKAENKVLGLKEFFETFQVKFPEGFLEKLSNDFTLFIYSGKNSTRLGFAAEIKDETGLSQALNSWEPTMEQDTEKLFIILGKQEKSSVPYFRTASYKNTSFRYLSFLPDNFGICYSLFNNYFFWTTSGESMTKVLDKLIQ